MGGAWVEREVAFAWAFNLAYSFHMPLFAFLSAYVLAGREKRPSEQLGRRALQLLVPYVAWVLIGGLLGGVPFGRLPAFVGAALLDPHASGAPWFLYALFGCFVVFTLVRARTKSEVALAVSAVPVAMLSLVPQTPCGDLLGMYDVALLYPFFVIGFLAATHRDAVDGQRRWLLPAGLVAWAALFIVVLPVMAPEASWWYLDYVARGLPGGFVLLLLARYGCALGGVITVFFLYDHVRGWLRDGQAFLGERTLGIYVVHGLILTALARLTDNLAVLTVATLTAALAITLVLERLPGVRGVLLGIWPRQTARPNR